MSFPAPATVLAQTSANQPLAIRCRGLTKRYGDLVVVNGLDLDVRVGECFGLLGPNGAGKTTTIEILEGLKQPSAGEVEVLGMRWDRDERRLRQKIGLTLQETGMTERLTVKDTLELFASFFDHGPSVQSLLNRVELTEKQDAWYENLSGGQKQRLAIACALVGNPELIFLDEPTSGLDPQSRQNLWELVLSFKAEGRTILLTTHYLEEAERLCDRVAVVDHGQVITLDTPAQLIQTLGGPVIELAVDGEISSAELANLPDVRNVLADRDGFLISILRPHLAVPALIRLLDTRSLPLKRFIIREGTLEDVFVQLTGKKLRD